MADAGGVNAGTPRPLVVWRLLDGKPGHESQSLGLARALARLTSVSVHDLPVRDIAAGPFGWLLRRFPAGRDLPDPDFIIGAGHATHWPLLCARRARGGRAVVLMKPSLPKRWFDRVVAPEHDGVRPGGNVIVTRGVLNAMRPGQKQAGRALVMVGGESKHFIWRDEDVLAAVSAIMTAWPGATITDSRRTPSDLSTRLARDYGDRFLAWGDCPPGWLAAELAQAEVAWVTEDSVSMIYEALTAGCAVGLLGLGRVQGSRRLVNGIDQLLRLGLLQRLAPGQVSGCLHQPPPLQEADRVARIIFPGSS